MLTDNKDTSIKGAEINSCEDEQIQFEDKDTEKDRNIDHGWAWVIVAGMGDICYRAFSFCTSINICFLALTQSDILP